MKMKFYILIIISVFCLKCASQGSPSGGPIDESGPEVISIESQNNIIGVRTQLRLYLMNTSINLLWVHLFL